MKHLIYTDKKWNIFVIQKPTSAKRNCIFHFYHNDLYVGYIETFHSALLFADMRDTETEYWLKLEQKPKFVNWAKKVFYE